ncbi:hypothetical protein SAY86_019019 [Trapa natans]|uniref:Uncharacterized protein n=1 Tax=Trapa natans TaxID=22666 RepID=A0AAN7R2A8_TRANT|nr:hypothetical protein SAY86_019019 [Trapa natans]
MATQKATSSASSSSILIGGTMTPFYASEVKDTRNNFISHLHHALTQRGSKLSWITTFVERGGDLERAY